MIYECEEKQKNIINDPEKYLANIGYVIFRNRIVRGLTPQELAEKSGISKKYILELEAIYTLNLPEGSDGKVKFPAIELLITIGNILDIRLERYFQLG